MTEAILACGPYFGEPGAVASGLVMLLAVKPLAYFFYIRAFRYRVSAAIPMTYGRAIKLALLRAVLGAVLVGLGTAMILMSGMGMVGFVAGWVYLYLSRIVAWWVIGRGLASIRGKRLVGWIVGGLAINGAFDVALIVGMRESWPAHAAVVLLLIVFIMIIESRGKRPALRGRFKEPICATCSYNLTGNLSGVCPECGTVIDQATLAKISASTLVSSE